MVGWVASAKMVMEQSASNYFHNFYGLLRNFVHITSIKCRCSRAIFGAAQKSQSAELCVLGYLLYIERLYLISFTHFSSSFVYERF